MEPIVVDGISVTSLGELDTEFTAYRIRWIFPFRSHAFFEEMIVGIDVQPIHFGNIIVHPTLERRNETTNPSLPLLTPKSLPLRP